MILFCMSTLVGLVPVCNAASAAVPLVAASTTPRLFNRCARAAAVPGVPGRRCLVKREGCNNKQEQEQKA
jgi:hypothetical protein